LIFWIPVAGDSTGENGGGKDGEASLQLLGSDARLHATHDGEPPPGASVDARVFAVEESRGADGNGDIEFVADVEAIESGGADANDLERMMVERESAANGVGRAAEMIAPETVVDDGERRAAALVVGDGE